MTFLQDALLYFALGHFTRQTRLIVEKHPNPTFYRNLDFNFNAKLIKSDTATL